MITEIIAIYAITDDLLDAIGQQEDCRVVMSDAEVVTTALVASRFLGSNHRLAQDYLKEHGLVPKMLDKSPFNRRLHRLFPLLLDVFDYLGSVLKAIQPTTEYLLESFPVVLCDNMRIRQARLVRSEQYRGYIASKKRFFYGLRVQLLATSTGIPVEFAFLPGAANDVRGLNALPLQLPTHSEIYAAAASPTIKLKRSSTRTRPSPCRWLASATPNAPTRPVWLTSSSALGTLLKLSLVPLPLAFLKPFTPSQWMAFCSKSLRLSLRLPWKPPLSTNISCQDHCHEPLKHVRLMRLSTVAIQGKRL